MLTNIIKNIFGTRNTRIIKEYRSLVKIINSLEDKYQKFSESDFIIKYFCDDLFLFFRQ